LNPQDILDLLETCDELSFDELVDDLQDSLISENEGKYCLCSQNLIKISIV